MRRKNLRCVSAATIGIIGGIIWYFVEKKIKKERNEQKKEKAMSNVLEATEDAIEATVSFYRYRKNDKAEKKLRDLEDSLEMSYACETPEQFFGRTQHTLRLISNLIKNSFPTIDEIDAENLRDARNLVTIATTKYRVTGTSS